MLIAVLDVFEGFVGILEAQGDVLFDGVELDGRLLEASLAGLDHLLLVGRGVRIEEDLLRALQAHGARLFHPYVASERRRETKIVKNDLFNWFFKSESYSRETSQESLQLDALDYVVTLSLLEYRRGTRRDNAWVRFALRIHDVETRELIDLVGVEGFYGSAMRALASAAPPKS